MRNRVVFGLALSLAIPAFVFAQANVTAEWTYGHHARADGHGYHSRRQTDPGSGYAGRHHECEAGRQ